MKKFKRPARRPGPVQEDSSDNSDSDGELVQCSTRSQGKKAKTSKPHNNPDSTEAPTQPKKAKLKRKKSLTPAESGLHSGSHIIKSNQKSKDGKGNNKKSTKVPESIGESSNNSGADEAPTQPIKKGKPQEKRLKPKVGDKPISDSDEQQTHNKGNGRGKAKKSSKAPEPMEESSNDSDSIEKPTQALKTGKGKTKKPSKVPEPMGDSSNDSDLDEKPTHLLKTGKGKAKKPSKMPEPTGESSDDSDLDEKPTHLLKTGKGKAKKPYKMPEPTGESPNDSGSPKRVVKTERDFSTLSEDIFGPPRKQAAALIKKQWCHGGGLKYVEKNVTTPQLFAFRDKESTFNEFAYNSDDSVSDDERFVRRAYTDAELHLRDLRHLRSVDPPFHDFLMEHDRELLDFDDHETALDDKEGDGSDEESVHVPGELHGDSDESDFEEEDAAPIKGKVTLKMVKDLEEELRKEGRIKLNSLNHVIKLFHAAVVRATSVDGSSEAGEFKVAGSSVFNAVLQMCVLYLPNAIKKYLNTDDFKEPQKCKHFVKIKGTLIQYLTDVLGLISAVTSDHILTTMLKHLHQMSKYVACFTRVSKLALRKLIGLWSTGEETVRVLAFLCILRITRTQDDALLTNVLKAMYMTYVKNCKFVSPTTWPCINFMRRCLVEMFSLNLNVSYGLAFLYVRQLGILLRNATVVKKLENIQAVYNWQYVNSLHMWADLLQTTTEHKDMEALFYPLTMIISYTIKLVPTPQYYPVRFLLTEVLLKMLTLSRYFIPVVGMMLDVFKGINYKKKNRTVSMKPLDFSCIIRLSKSQMRETGLNDTLVDKLYALLLQYTAATAHRISSPDLNLIIVLHLKNFILKCTVPNQSKKMKQLLEKIEENAIFMNKRYKEMPYSLFDLQAIRTYENAIKTGPNKPPLLIFYENWAKINKIQKRKSVTKNDELAENIPKITKRPQFEEDLVKIDNDAPVTLFPSDSEDDNMEFFKTEEENDAPKKKKAKKQKKADKQPAVKKEVDIDVPIDDAGDIVQELSVNDW